MGMYTGATLGRGPRGVMGDGGLGRSSTVQVK
jgi:hypothetical protein